MGTRLTAIALFALYQITLAVGILALPLAMVARRFGLSLPIHRAVVRLGEAYERASASVDA